MDNGNRFNLVFGRAQPPTAMNIPLPALRLDTSLPSAQAGAEAPAQPSESEAARVRERVVAPPPPAGPAGLDNRRIGQNALVSAISQGGCFGTAFALNNYLRMKAPPMIKRLAAVMTPLLAGFLTSPAEKLTRERVGMQPTRASAPSIAHELLHDAIPSIVLYAVNAAYVKSRLPKRAPTTPAGALTTLALSVGATSLAGALSEAAAQTSGGKPMPALTSPEATQRGIKRALCLLPMSRANWKAANYVIDNKKSVPPEMALDPLKAGTRGWLLRNFRWPTSPLSQAPVQPGISRQPSPPPAPATATPTVQPATTTIPGDSRRPSQPAKPPSPAPSSAPWDCTPAP